MWARVSFCGATLIRIISIRVAVELVYMMWRAIGPHCPPYTGHSTNMSAAQDSYYPSPPVIQLKEGMMIHPFILITWNPRCDLGCGRPVQRQCRSTSFASFVHTWKRLDFFSRLLGTHTLAAIQLTYKLLVSRRVVRGFHRCCTAQENPGSFPQNIAAQLLPQGNPYPLEGGPSNEA